MAKAKSESPAEADVVRGQTAPTRIASPPPVHVEQAESPIRIAERLIDDGPYLQQVLSRGELRHNTAVGRVRLHLRVNDIGQNFSSILHDCRRGLVARCFDAKNQHDKSLNLIKVCAYGGCATPRSVMMAVTNW